MLAHLSSLEAQYVVRLLVGRFDVGVETADVELALARRRSQSEFPRAADRRRPESQTKGIEGRSRRGSR